MNLTILKNVMITGREIYFGGSFRGVLLSTIATLFIGCSILAPMFIVIGVFTWCWQPALGGIIMTTVSAVSGTVLIELETKKIF